MPPPVPRAHDDGTALDDLHDELLRVAREASRAARTGDAVGVGAIAEQLTERIRAATGDALTLLEVARAFLVAAQPSAGSEDARIVGALMAHASGVGASLLDRLVAGERVDASALDALDATEARLIGRLRDRGVLRVQGDALALDPRSASVVREQIEPLVFRLWRTVETARRHASLLREQSKRAELVAGMTGVELAQAQRFVARELAAGSPPVSAQGVTRYARPAAGRRPGEPRGRADQQPEPSRNTAPDSGDAPRLRLPEEIANSTRPAPRRASADPQRVDGALVQ